MRLKVNIVLLAIPAAFMALLAVLVWTTFFRVISGNAQPIRVEAIGHSASRPDDPRIIMHCGVDPLCRQVMGPVYNAPEQEPPE